MIDRPSLMLIVVNLYSGESFKKIKIVKIEKKNKLG